MIERISISNFKSIRTKVEIDFSPGGSKVKRDHISENGCLRAVSFFGANASGKSNIIKAIKFIKRLITDPSYETIYPAYNWDSGDDVSKFEIDFTIGNEKEGYSTYSYAIDVRTKAVSSEKRSKQSFRYEILKERLSVTDSSFETIEVISKNMDSKDKYNKEQHELIEKQHLLESLQENLESLQKKIASVNKDIAATASDKKLLENDHEDTSLACKILSVILRPELFGAHMTLFLESSYGSEWIEKLYEIAELLSKNKSSFDYKNWLSLLGTDSLHNKSDSCSDFDVFLDYYKNSADKNNYGELVEQFANWSKSNHSEESDQGISHNDKFFELIRNDLSIANLREEFRDISMKSVDKCVKDLGINYVNSYGRLNIFNKMTNEMKRKCENTLKNAFVHLKEIENKIVKNETKLSDLNQKNEYLNNTMKSTISEIDGTRSALLIMKENTDILSESLLHSGKFEDYLAYDVLRRKMDHKEIKRIVDKAYRWFVSTLFILETDDYYLPINRPNLLNELSEVLNALDVGIYGLEWKDTYRGDVSGYGIKEIDYIKSRLSEKDWLRVSECQNASTHSSCSTSLIVKTDSELNLFTYYLGEENVKKLVAYHNKGLVNPTNILSESDGTRRLIELASILLPTDSEKVFIVDELDRRLHPSLTMKFIELFMNEKNMNKQLIFVTHETRLMTTEIFRPDEIRLVSMEDDTTNVDSLDEIIRKDPKKFSKRTDRMYLEELLLPGIPKIEN